MADLHSWNLKKRLVELARNAERISEDRLAIPTIFGFELLACTFLPLPVALLLVGVVTAAPRRWAGFAMGATLGSVAGGIVLYVIGWAFFASIGERLVVARGAPERWANVVDWFNSEWGMLFLLLAGMTTGLFRIASLGAGFTGANPVVALGILFISRAVRFLAECAAIKYVGERARTWPVRYFKYAAVGVFLVLITSFLAFTFGR